MGCYAQCWLGDFYVGSSKDDIDPGLISLFRRADKKVTSDPRAVIPHQIKHWLDSLESDEDLPLVYYSAPITVIRDRLDFMGYTLDTAREAFEEYVKGEKQQKYEWSKRQRDKMDEKTEALLHDYYETTLSSLEELNVSSWLEGLEKIRKLGLKTNYIGRYEGPYEGTLIGYMLSEEWYGFPGPDINIALRLALEICPDAQELIYDVTGLILSGYFELDDDLVEYGIRLAGDEYLSKAKTIILTEGRSDAWILEESLRLLYPHLADYYSFMEFDLVRVGGGAGNLANLVKAFAGAGIVNKTIALFDNDTAAAAAIKSLERIKLPSHIKVVKLPESEFLRNYPTIGPGGSKVMDVNGIASSIELFLGEDILLDDKSQLTPIQWTGYDAGMRQYQGEVLNKDRIHDNFRRKLEQAKLNRNALMSEQWNGLREVFSALISAFHDIAKKEICKWAREYFSR